jgi:hypothetical protein
MAALFKSKPWSVAEFEKYRPELTVFVRDEVMPLLEEHGCRRIVIRAPVKSGKREIVEYTAMRDGSSVPHRVHVFISAWHRIADEDQREELSKHNLKVFSIVNNKKVDDCLQWLSTQIAGGKEVVIHLDECDHGSGQKQLLSKVWKHVRAQEKIMSILYSATPQEVLFSGEVDDVDYLEMIDEIKEGHVVKYEPAPSTKFCGPAKFLQENLVTDAKPFFYSDLMKLSPQAKEILSDLRWNLATEPSRNIVVLRLSYSDLGGKQGERMKNKAIYQFLQNIKSFPELEGVSITVDKADNVGFTSPNFRTEAIQWSSRQYWEDRASGKPMIIVIDQTSSRSTEWACHDRIFATHDFRNVLQFSTISQAQERVNHYEGKYGGFQSIRIYGHKNTFLLSADKIDYKSYLTLPWIKQKVDKRTAGTSILWQIKDKIGGTVNPSFPVPLSTTDANRALQELGCFADVSLSARVADRIEDKRTFTSTWRAATKETWDAVCGAMRADPVNSIVKLAGARNPFFAAETHRLANGVWQGYHRGWKVLDYDTNVKGDAGWGVDDGRRIKVCYKDGVLGVAFCWGTGSVNVLSIKTVKSMYASE